MAWTLFRNIDLQYLYQTSKQSYAFSQELHKVGVHSSLCTRVCYGAAQRVYNVTSVSKERLLIQPYVASILINICAAYEKNGFFAYAKTKMQISCAVTAQLISAFVFVTHIVR